MEQLLGRSLQRNIHGRVLAIHDITQLVHIRNGYVPAVDLHNAFILKPGYPAAYGFRGHTEKVGNITATHTDIQFTVIRLIAVFHPL